MQNWRMLDYSSKDPRINLAIEEAILRCHLKDRNTNTLRLWQNPPSVVIGCFQNPKSEVNVAICKKLGINIVRRVSGGGSVYHDYGNLNYSLSIRKHSLKANLNSVEKSYAVFCSGVIEGLKMLGITAHNRETAIMIGRKKISGSAQYRLYDAVLHHGALMIDVNLDMMKRVLRISNPKDILINLYDVLQRKVQLSEIKRAIASGFEKSFNVKIQEGVLTLRERQVTKWLYKKKYSKEDWNIGMENNNINFLRINKTKF